MDATRDLDALLRRLLADYAAGNPQVALVHDLLAAAGKTVVHDHLALRTWGDPRCDIAVLARPFLAAGYRVGGSYRFPGKHLIARHLEHDDPARPLVFISELVLGECSHDLQDRVAAWLAQVPAARLAAPDLCATGRPWQVAHAEVAALRRESEYAAWLATFGWCANHFTVLTNGLGELAELARLNDLLRASGLALNAVGGEIKGSAAAGLEQSSTLAAEVAVAFTDGTFTVPGCYYEFARRHPGADGRLFRGFIEGSADKIFTSTDRSATPPG